MTLYYQRSIARSHLRVTLRIWLKVYQSALRTIRPPLDACARLWLGQAFLVSGLLKLADWDNAVYLATHEYPVSWMSPLTAAVTGVSIEVICPVFLILGLFTRAAALPMLALTLVSQFAYHPFDTNLFWAALLGWYVIHGPDALSLDRILAAGIRDSALPLLPRAVRYGDWLRAHAAPYYLAALRLWMSFGLSGLPANPDFVPVRTFGALPSAVALPAAVLGAMGFGMQILSKALFVGFVSLQIMDSGRAESLYVLLFFGLLGLYGGGSASSDDEIASWLRSRIMPDKTPADIPEDWPHIVIIGAGFGGIACASRLRHLPVRVTLIDRNNYHLFQPLLYQVATANLSPADIAAPARGLFRDDPNVTVLMGAAKGIDTQRKQVLLENQALSYDMLVLATGASHSYFGRDEWAPFAPGLKRVEDAVAVRSAILSAFERAETARNGDERRRLLTFVIVGGGPTGVELAGAIAELARFGLRDEYRRIDPASARIVLVQSGDTLLPSFPPKLAAEAKRSLERLGVEVRLGGRVTHIDDHNVLVGDTCIEADTVLWAAGVVASPAASWLNVEADRSGRVIVNSDLSVAGLPDIFAIGDTAASNAWNGRPVPGLAPAAKQGGEYVARVIRSHMEGRRAPRPFRYRHMGSLATIGRKSAVADFGWLRLRGAPAWWLWGLVHVLFLGGGRNRLTVMVHWVWSYLTFRVGVRLITESAQTEQRQPSVIAFPVSTGSLLAKGG